MNGGPEVVAHRGSSAEKPEHTLSAYLRAIEQGADALECDVRLTADGHLVCVHDRKVNRTSNGRGVVSTLELAHLEQLDWGSWMQDWDDADSVETPDRDHGRLLTLRRLLDAVRDCGRPVQVAIETKHPTRYAGLVERTLARVLAEYGWDGAHPQFPSPVRVMSFSSLALQRMRQRSPDVPRVLLVEDRIPVRMRDGTLPKGVGTVGIDVRLLRRHQGFVRSVQGLGGKVHVWTVDRDEDVELCLALGVDAIITNRPRHVLELLGRGVHPA
ncbi:glycerophosphodiester phosphodiesterase [Angustibacter luteus]|uniref:Glycerophosphodiester phosphodiesterase n=1 Tax=Angustibacter luteus TaxID=658456 RepID=A0ABW1JDT1_9ACTN